MSKIKYFTHPKNSIFEGMQIRENTKKAFDNAIKRGMKNPEDWMYMYSEKGRDFFKHSVTRGYKSYPQFSIIERFKNMFERIKNKIQNNR